MKTRILSVAILIGLITLVGMMIGFPHFGGLVLTFIGAGSILLFLYANIEITVHHWLESKKVLKERQALLRRVLAVQPDHAAPR